MRILVGMTLIAMTTAAAASGPAAATERREHGAHRHGHATLQAALDGGQLEIAVEAPGMDIVGFEHAPGDDAQKAKIAAALRRLGDAGAMFDLPEAAGCALTEAEAEQEALADAHGQKADAADHTAFHAHYGWTCAKPEALQTIRVRYFEHFPGIAEIDAAVIGPSGQTAQELTPQSPQLQF